MHVGHLRSTIIGDALSRVIEFEGHKVIRQNHIGDWGTQFGMLIAHMRNSFHAKEPGGVTGAHWKDGSPFGDLQISDLEAFYRGAKRAFDKGPLFQHTSRETVVRLQRGDAQELHDWKIIVDESRLEFQPIYKRLNVKLVPADDRGESSYNGSLPTIVQELKSQNIATDSEGAVVVFIDGPDKTPLIIQKSDGGYLYGTTDLAAIRYRINELHADRIIYTHDSRQAQHFRRSSARPIRRVGRTTEK